MRPLGPEEIAPREIYEELRPDFRARIVELKRTRRVAVGDRVSVVFENRETMRFQVQEMIRIERIDAPDAIQHELDAYNPLIPGDGELSATLFIEIPDLARIKGELDRLVGIDAHVSLRVGDERIPAAFDPGQMEEDRISAVQYIRFGLDPGQRARFADPAVPVALSIDHPEYRHATPLESDTRESLAADLRGECPVLIDGDAIAGEVPGPRLLEEGDGVRVVQLTDRHRVVERSAPAATDAPLGADPAALRAVERHARALRERHGRVRVELDLEAEPPTWHLRAGS